MQNKVFAPAKVNLCLHVTGRRGDGYHLLDSLVMFADIGDMVSVSPADQFSLVIDGPFGDVLTADEDNLVMRAARQFSRHCNGADIRLTKNLPVASGIGGGSADAAATLHAMAALTGMALPDDHGLSLGADVPVCLQGECCQMQGIGEEIMPMRTFSQLHAVLVCPNVAVSTPRIFDQLKDKENTAVASFPTDDIDIYDTIDWISKQRNDLEAPAKELTPVIAKALDVLVKSGARLSRMSGSGATCFGLYINAQDAKMAAIRIAQDYPDWWVTPTILGDVVRA